MAGWREGRVIRMRLVGGWEDCTTGGRETAEESASTYLGSYFTATAVRAKQAKKTHCNWCLFWGHVATCRCTRCASRCVGGAHRRTATLPACWRACLCTTKRVRMEAKWGRRVDGAVPGRLPRVRNERNKYGILTQFNHSIALFGTAVGALCACYVCVLQQSTCHLFVQLRNGQKSPEQLQSRNS